MACIVLADNNLKQMIRYFYSICFLVIGMGLSQSAQNSGTYGSTPSGSSKAGTKRIPSACPAHLPSVAQAKEKSDKKSEVIVTSDISRKAVSASLAAKQQSLSPTPTRSARNERRVGTEEFPLVTRNLSPVCTEANPGQAAAGGRLARVTAYWAGEGDYYTGRGISATGVRLHDGHCAVDPRIIPYGSVVEIAGVGKFLAVDTGSAVISRTAAKEGGHTSEERGAIVVDLYFESRVDGEKFAASTSKYVSISWWTPASKGTEAKAARSLFAEEDWNKIQSKQL